MWDFFYIYTVSYMCGAIKSSCGAAIRKSKNQYFKVINKSIMAAQSCKKKRWRKFFAVLHWICIDSSRPYGRLLENQKTGGSRELFLPEYDFQTSSTVNFPKNHPDFKIKKKSFKKATKLNFIIFWGLYLWKFLES